jgi:hypothetical protein
VSGVDVVSELGLPTDVDHIVVLVESVQALRGKKELMLINAQIGPLGAQKNIAVVQPIKKSQETVQFGVQWINFNLDALPADCGAGVPEWGRQQRGNLLKKSLLVPILCSPLSLPIQTRTR